MRQKKRAAKPERPVKDDGDDLDKLAVLGAALFLALLLVGGAFLIWGWA